MNSHEEDLDIWLLDNPKSLQITVGFLIASCALSVLGSSALLYNIIRNKKHKQSLYHRILVGMSAMDLLGNLGYATSVFAVPRNTHLYFAMGNRWTCRANGALHFFVPVLFLYQAELSLYFMLMLRYKWKELTVARRLEPLVHIIPVLFLATFVALSLSLDSIHPDVFVGICDFGPYPEDCVGNTVPGCANASKNVIIVRIFSLILLFAVFFGICSTWVAYSSVSRTYSRNRRHSFRGSMDDQMERRRRDMMTQSLLYTIAFTAMLGLIVYANLDLPFREDDLRGKTAHLSFVFFVVPFQGFINFCIFFRLRVRSWKEKNSERSFFWTLWMAVTGGEPIFIRRELQQGVEDSVDELADCEDGPSDTLRFGVDDDRGTHNSRLAELDSDFLMFPSLE